MTINFGGAAGDDVDVGNPTTLQLTGACTIACWARLHASAQNIEMISKQTSSARGFSLQTDDDPPTNTWPIFVVAKNASQVQSSGWSTTPMLINTWYHIAGVYIPSTSIGICVDGVRENEKTTGVTASMHDPANNVTFAGRPDDIGNLDGCLDDVRIYNRALSDDEVMVIAGSRGKDSILNGCVSRWLMNEASPGTTPVGAGSVIDMMNAGNHGTPNGGNVYASSRLSFRR